MKTRSPARPDSTDSTPPCRCSIAVVIPDCSDRMAKWSASVLSGRLTAAATRPTFDAPTLAALLVAAPTHCLRRRSGVRGMSGSSVHRSSG
jgi:hypothetical protein